MLQRTRRRGSDHDAGAAPAKNRDFSIGTSGWHYAHWKGSFYPADLPNSEMLSFYSRQFWSVEINNSFYRLPSLKALEHWIGVTSEDFVFSMKASRFITHRKKLKDPGLTLPPFLRAARTLGSRLGPLLFQLPPRWSAAPQRLAEFFEHMPDEFRCTFEFRDPSWFRDDVYEILSRAHAALCIHDINGRLSPKEITTDFIYVRLHGPGPAYRGSYDVGSLAGWAKDFAAWARKGLRIYCYFDNDEKAFAVQDALSLQAMLQSG